MYVFLRREIAVRRRSRLTAFGSLSGFRELFFTKNLITNEPIDQITPNFQDFYSASSSLRVQKFSWKFWEKKLLLKKVDGRVCFFFVTRRKYLWV